MRDFRAAHLGIMRGIGGSFGGCPDSQLLCLQHLLGVYRHFRALEGAELPDDPGTAADERIDPTLDQILCAPGAAGLGLGPGGGVPPGDGVGFAEAQHSGVGDLFGVEPEPGDVPGALCDSLDAGAFGGVGRAGLGDDAGDVGSAGLAGVLVELGRSDGIEAVSAASIGDAKAAFQGLGAARLGAVETGLLGTGQFGGGHRA